MRLILFCEWTFLFLQIYSDNFSNETKTKSTIHVNCVRHIFCSLWKVEQKILCALWCAVLCACVHHYSENSINEFSAESWHFKSIQMLEPIKYIIANKFLLQWIYFARLMRISREGGEGRHSLVILIKRICCQCWLRILTRFLLHDNVTDIHAAERFPRWEKSLLLGDIASHFKAHSTYTHANKSF